MMGGWLIFVRYAGIICHPHESKAMNYSSITTE